MSDAERDPHVLVSARVRANPKIIDLSSDRARWGWIVVLGEAKLSRPAGRFASRHVLNHLIGEYRRFVPEYVSAGLLHVAPDLCDHCLACVGPVRVGELIVHDWSRHQDRASRTTEWRRDHGVPSGHVNVTGETSGKRTGNTGGNDGETLARGRVSARVGQSLSPSQSSSTEGGGAGEETEEPEFVLRQWLVQRGCLVREGDGFDQRLITACEVHGPAAILAQFERLEELGIKRGDVQGYVFGAIDALNRASRPNLRAVEDDGAAERLAIRSRRTDEQMWQRRLETYQWTGEWHEELGWGPAPERKGAPA